MRTNLALRNHASPLARLAALADLSERDMQALHLAEQRAKTFAACRAIVREGEAPLPPSIVLDGWAARVTDFADGRRQILNLVLPGECIGKEREQPAHASTSVVALTTVRICPAPDVPDDDDRSGLPAAYAADAALMERYLLRQIARLGRMSALDRIADCFLELQERLALAGFAATPAFPMPLTQEMLADALGLTSVHVNRTLQLMRREGNLELRNGMVRLPNAAGLAASVGYKSAMRAVLPG